MTELTLNQLMRATHAEEDAAEIWLEPLNEAMCRYEINNPLRQAAFLAQVGEESGGLRVFSENLNYSASALIRQWPKRFTPAQAALYGRTESHSANQRMIANLAYGGRFGNPAGEGWKWRGRGPLQLTFFDNYAACSKGIGVDLMTDPDVVFEPTIGALTAAWYFKKAGCNALADDGDFIEITQRVNGGQINAERRMALYVSAKNAFDV